MKWLFRIAAILITIVALALLALVLVPTERVAQLAADRFSAETGRALTIDGPVKATLWPRLGVRAEGIEVANADWSVEGPMLAAGTLDVGIALSSLLGGDVRIESIAIDGAVLVLERRADGRGNWEFAFGGGPQTADVGAGNDTNPPRGVTIDRAVLTDARITWIDHGPATRVDLQAVDATADLAGLDGPLRVAGSALLDGQAITLEASAEAARALLDGALTPVALTLAAGGTSLRLDGRADLDPLSFEGRAEATTTDGFAIAALVGAAPLDLPRGLGRDRIDLQADVTLAPGGTVHLREMTVELDDNRLTGALDIAPHGERTRVSGTLASDGLTFTSGTASSDGAGPERPGGSGGPARGWSREIIDVSGLFALDADLSLSTGPIVADGFTVDEMRARVTLENGRAVVALQPVLAYGGTVTGEMVVNGRGGLSSRATLQLAGLEMQPFLTAFAGFDRLVGRADGAIDLLGVGDTMQALADSLSGGASFRFGRGEILGLDIPGMIRTLDVGFRGAGQKTVFDGLTGSFAIDGGVARGEDLSLTGEYLTARGEGRIGLGGRTIDYRLLPTLRRGVDSEGITVPILIEGPWADPSIRPDLEFLARQRIDVERAEIEAQARETARAKLAAELDVAPETLDSRGAVEEAVKEKIASELLKLFDR